MTIEDLARQMAKPPTRAETDTERLRDARLRGRLTGLRLVVALGLPVPDLPAVDVRLAEIHREEHAA